MRVRALIASYRGTGLIGDTVRAVLTLAEVDDVVVVDDGSGDGTAQEAADAGARVLVAPENLGKGGVIEAALDRLPPTDVYLLLDQDLGGSAAAAGALLEPIMAGEADLTIAVLPRHEAHGGFRLVKRMSRLLIRALSGFRAEEPMSGQRAIRAAALAALRPLAPGFGLELGMTVDARRAGLRLVEVPVPFRHAPTGRDLAGFLHRARQGRDHLRAALHRLIAR